MHGLKMTPTDRGFSVELGAIGKGCTSIGIAPVWLALPAAGVVMCGLSSTLSSWITATLAAVSVVVAALAILASMRNTSDVTTLVLEADVIRATLMDGTRRQLRLDALKGVDAIPVGLSIRCKDGVSLHVAMRGASREARRWLAGELDGAVRRHGDAAHVPEDIRRLQTGRDPGERA